jgi:putative ABC transport system permease protein
VWRGNEANPLAGEIVGIVGSVRWQSMAAEPPAAAYWWFAYAPDRELTIVARTTGSPGAMAASFAAQLREIDPSQPVGAIRPLSGLVAADLARPRFTMLLLGIFAACALLLAAIGVYGVTALSVSGRTREIGVRMALGARYSDVLQLVLGRGMALVGAGLVVGGALALALSRFMTSLLYGVSPADPATYVAVTLFLIGVALFAIYLPARRAARVDPMVVLQQE